MSTTSAPTRRTAIGLLLTAAFVGPATSLRAQAGPAIKIYKEATCGCCTIWARHMAAAGFSVTATDVPSIDAIKVQLGVPNALATCHTAEVGGYLVEGHVPASVVRRLLAETPPGRGLAVPGMPIGSPGMEGGTPEIYQVYLFGPHGVRPYARCRGTQEI